MSGSHLSKDFFELIKNIGECKSKQEEDKILAAEVSVLKQRFSETLKPKQKKEALVRVMYAEMLGHNAEFGHIHAVNLTQETNLLSKRVGYLASAVCLWPGHELTTLIVNTLRRDVASSNHVEVCAALICIPKVVSVEFLPALFQPVLALLDHSLETVRKKTVMVLHRFYSLDPSCMLGNADKLRRALCDKDPAVMGASLYILHEMAEADLAAHKDLVPSFVSILKQITEHRLPSSFDYHRMPAPWIQIKLLKLLATLGANDQKASEAMYDVLYDVMRRADTGINIGYAVIYDTVRTITTIYPNIQLLETAASHIARFVSTENHNLKYLGIKALTGIVQVNQKYALDHQMVVVECLEDPDETLKRKTLDLLFAMTNATNVVFVVETLITHLRATTDVPFRTSLVERLTQLAERYAPDNNWYITTMNQVFELGGELVRHDIAHNLMRLIAEGSGEDEDIDMELRRYAATQYYTLLAKPQLPDILMQIVCWVLGEYGHLCRETALVDIAERLCDSIERQFTHLSTRCWVVSALAKLVAQIGSVPEQVEEVAAKFTKSSDVALSKYCIELSGMAQHMGMMKAAMPVDASCEDLETDEKLGFLNAFVANAIAQGAQQYIPRGQREGDIDVDDSALAAGSSKPAASTMRFEEYEKAELPVMVVPDVIPTAVEEEAPKELGTGLNMGGAAVGAAHQPAPPTASHIGGDPFIRVLAETSVQPESTEVVIYLEPTTGALRNMTLQLDPGAALKIGVSAAPPAAAAGTRVTIPMLSPGGAARLAISVTCAAAVGAETPLLGQLVYSDAASVTDTRVVSFRLVLGLRQLLRPNVIQTQDFGGMWPAHSQERKSMIAPCAVAADANAYNGLIQSKLHIYPVQTIGMECIACTKLVGTVPQQGLTCLVHAKLGQMNGRALELTLRSKDPRLTDALQKEVTAVLQGGV